MVIKPSVKIDVTVTSIGRGYVFQNKRAMDTSEVPETVELPEDLLIKLQSGEVPAFPGMKLWPICDQFVSGEGTYVDNGFLFTSLVGVLKASPANNNKTYIEVVPLGGGAALARAGDIVTAVVARVSVRGARCELRCAGSRPLARPLRAQLLKENVHETNKDRVDMYKSVRPGDIIIAKVLPVTSLQYYELTTAEPELGVVIARAADGPPGVNMVPLSWNEMQCPVTLIKEPRKVAKLVPENIYDLMKGKTSKHASDIPENILQ